MLLKFVNIKGDESYTDDDKNIQNIMWIRLLDFTLFHIKEDDIQVMLNRWEVLVKVFFFKLNFKLTACKYNKNAVSH